MEGRLHGPAAGAGRTASTQPPQSSALNRNGAPEIAWANAHGIGVIVYSLMDSGLLAGSFSAERVASLPDDDWRKHHTSFTTGLAERLTVVDALRPIAERNACRSPPSRSRGCWRGPGVTGAVVGARTASQMDGWLPAVRLDLPPEGLVQIAAILPGEGPVPGRPLPTEVSAFRGGTLKSVRIGAGMSSML
ncbi:aldo/keto reductase [Nonomuraea soli]|uniref:Aryl-alcohol dehydrogenase-like predicted oxidoreductase n=1 Tax=Nonomuraea soli TaxID=1032476 RepID=A0A7W0HQV3_9ACTN|nr:aldo/keto reductase [Nonomuraea soli]MBA2892344.1 aryl-alcohol dehydrogenase-like predicted oxidoreductase [Nonomuraea soli]